MHPAKSSSSIFRDLTDYFNKQIGIICTELATLPEHIKCVVFFDDILGTGSQFETFVKKYQLDKSHLNFLYIPLAAIRESVERINTMYSNIKVYPVEFIDPSCSFFSGSSPLMNFNEKEHSAEFLSVYTNICKKNNIKLKNSKGRGDNALTYIFHHSTPNNNLALLWYEDENWTYLFKR
ncbi:TPA: hypothetical protein ACGE8O_002756 [Yersinia enterocolitica]|nr:hypothetical protein [Yersinia enterocolitica]